MKSGTLLAMFTCLARSAAAWEGWHPEAYPTAEHYFQPAATVGVYWVENRVVVTNWASCTNAQAITNVFYSDIRPDAGGTDTVVNTWTFDLAIYTNGPAGTCYASVVTRAVTVTGGWSAASIRMGPQEIWAYDDYRARVERWRALGDSTTSGTNFPASEKPRFYRWHRDNLLASKAWWLEAARLRFVDTGLMREGTLDGWFATNATWQWSSGATSIWVRVNPADPPTWTEQRLCDAAGLPYDLTFTTVTGTLDGWKVGDLTNRYVTGVVYQVTNAVRSWFDVTPYQYLNCGGSSGFPATVNVDLTYYVTLDPFACFDACGSFCEDGCSLVTTVETCNGSVVLTATNGQPLTVTCTSAIYAAGSTSIEYGWCGLRAVVTNLTTTWKAGRLANRPTDRSVNYYGKGIGLAGLNNSYAYWTSLPGVSYSNYSAGHYVYVAKSVAPGGGTGVVWAVEKAWGSVWIDTDAVNWTMGRQADYYGYYARPIRADLAADATTTLHRVAGATVAAGPALSSNVSPALVFTELPYPPEPALGTSAGTGRELRPGPVLLRWDFDYQ